MFIATGGLANARSQSIVLISEPGSGKTELLERFSVNGKLQYASDLTVMGLDRILKSAKQGIITHIVATEFQKFFLRKAATWENTLGRLCQALEEGVREVHTGEHTVDLGGAQIGLIAAITHDTASGKNRILKETGFWSRVAAFEWEMPFDEVHEVMNSINEGDRSDLEQVVVSLPERRIKVSLPGPLSKQFQDYVMGQMREHTVMRVFQRFRALAMGCALLEGRDIVHAVDIEKVVAFSGYWDRMITGDGRMQSMRPKQDQPTNGKHPKGGKRG
jgi:hypothetical protein